MQLTPSTDSTVDTAVRAVLERDERLLWSGQPDLRAMEKGRGHACRGTCPQSFAWLYESLHSAPLPGSACNSRRTSTPV
jgi:hypothetical protein